MSGIFYNPGDRTLHRVHTAPERGWLLVTHDTSASTNRCRRIMREWLAVEELISVDWRISTYDQPV